MATAKDIIIRPITSAEANAVVKRYHYSGKVVSNSQVHFGVFLGEKLGGALQFGPPLDRRKIIPLVRGTLWNEMLELNRMALADWLPRNSESRALAVCFRLMRKQYPHLKWVVSFSDGAQCGDGTIYRAAGFVLTGIKRNNQCFDSGDGVFSRASLTGHSCEIQKQKARQSVLKSSGGAIDPAKETNGASTMRPYIQAGWKPIDGFQLRYVFFLQSAQAKNLTVKPIDFAEIDRLGARMYKGKKCPGSKAGVVPGYQPGEGGSTPTPGL